MANITFLIDSTSKELAAGKGGSSPNAATPVSHPPFALNGTLSDPEYKVPIGRGETVVIYTQEKNQLPMVKIAPCGIIAHTFQGDPLTTDIMKDPAKRPIDIPNFDMDPGPVPDFIAFLGDDNPQWVP